MEFRIVAWIAGCNEMLFQLFCAFILPLSHCTHTHCCADVAVVYRDDSSAAEFEEQIVVVFGLYFSFVDLPRNIFNCESILYGFLFAIFVSTHLSFSSAFYLCCVIIGQAILIAERNLWNCYCAIRTQFLFTLCFYCFAGERERKHEHYVLSHVMCVLGMSRSDQIYRKWHL